MDRRSTSRVDLRLTCRIVNQGFVSENSGGTTENISRNGLLLRWTRPSPVPAAGSALRVELELPSEGVFAPRVIRCDSTVVRVIAGENGQSHVALKVNTMRFVEDAGRIWAGAGRSSSPISELVN
ncbi:MAG TPA: PilZ domain-containing protein [Bryobacteraceae bacterium]|nr:PilZ domain-containing protein [Bryobacteraceae bacterium]